MVFYINAINQARDENIFTWTFMSLSAIVPLFGYHRRCDKIFQPIWILLAMFLQKEFSWLAWSVDEEQPSPAKTSQNGITFRPCNEINAHAASRAEGKTASYGCTSKWRDLYVIILLVHGIFLQRCPAAGGCNLHVISPIPLPVMQLHCYARQSKRQIKINQEELKVLFIKQSNNVSTDKLLYDDHYAMPLIDLMNGNWKLIHTVQSKFLNLLLRSCLLYWMGRTVKQLICPPVMVFFLWLLRRMACFRAWNGNIHVTD